MNIPKKDILAAVRRQTKLMYVQAGHAPSTIADNVDRLISILDKLPASFFKALPNPGYANDDMLITIIVQKHLKDLPKAALPAAVALAEKKG